LFTPSVILTTIFCIDFNSPFFKKIILKEKIIKLISNKRGIFLILTLFSVAISIQALVTQPQAREEGGIEYQAYNNYTIFKNSFVHLVNNQDLYLMYPKENWDLFKYTPTFSALFGFFAIFPDWIGLNLWNLLNVWILVFAIYYLPRLDDFAKVTSILIVLIELITSIQNEQSNALLTGLIIFTFGLLENKRYFFATLMMAISVYIKLFGIVGFALFLFYPDKWKLIKYTSFWMVILFLIPLIFVSFDQYIQLFISYRQMLIHDQSISYGYSVMGILNSWFGLKINMLLIILTGMAVFLIPLFKFKAYQNYLFRLLALSSILIWVVIFNYKAESPTFIIAMAGVALWFVKAKINALNIGLLVLAILLTSLSPTDIFPSFLRNEYVIPFTLKALPCILIWMKIIYDMIRMENSIKPEELNS